MNKYSWKWKTHSGSLLTRHLAFEESGPLQGLGEGSCRGREMTGQGGWREEALNSDLEGQVLLKQES